jgi:hypothetical protein
MGGSYVSSIVPFDGKRLNRTAHHGPLQEGSHARTAVQRAVDQRTHACSKATRGVAGGQAGGVSFLAFSTLASMRP